MKIGNIDLGEYPLLLAPMEDVTDVAFRLLCKRFGADMVYTEFVSSDALIRDVASTKRKLIIDDEFRFVGEILMLWWKLLVSAKRLDPIFWI